MKAEEKAKELYPITEGMDKYGDTYDVYESQRAAFLKGFEFAQQQAEQKGEVFELGASAFQDCLNPHTLEFDHETFKRLKEEAVNQNK